MYHPIDPAARPSKERAFDAIRQQRGLVGGVGTSNAAQQVEAIKARLPQLETVLLAETNLFQAKVVVSTDFVASKALGGG